MNIQQKWAILECPICKKRGYYYLGNDIPPHDINKFEYAGFSKNDLECSTCHIEKIEIPYDEWTAEDLAEIFGNELEDRNHHWLTNMPQLLLQSLTEANLPTDTYRTQIMRSFMEKMIDSM